MAEHVLPEGLEGGVHYFALPKGAKLFEFEIAAVLGHGGFGITYLATDMHLQEAVAIKEYLPNDLAVRISDATVRPKSAEDKPSFESGLKAFLEEARLLARIRHVNIIRVRRFFEAHGTGYIVQDFEEGRTLSKRLSEGPLSEGELRAIVSGVLDGLEEVHERAVLHRDLKPSNIMLRGDGTAVLIDFGAARDFKSRHSRSVTAIATPGYTPPEQFGIGGQQGPWTDLYALGAILYRCVTGAPPLDSLRRLRNDPLVPAGVAAEGKYSAALLCVIDWMLQVDEAKRPGSVQAVREALASGRAPEQAEQKSTLSMTIKPAGPGRVLIELPGSIHADVLELSFFVTPPDQYLTPSLSGKPVWRNQPHYLEVYRSEGAAGHASFEVGAEIVNAIPAQAHVTISSADGFVHGSAIWSGTPAVVAADKPKRRWPMAAAAAVLAVVVLSIAGYGLYALYQKQQEEKLLQLTRQLKEARFDAGALGRFRTACGASCPETLRDEAKSRLDQIGAEEASFRAAQDDVTRLRAYINECRVCIFRPEAETRVARLEQQRFERLQQQFRAAGSNLTELENLLRECGPTCPEEFRSQAQTLIATIRAQEAALRREQEEAAAQRRQLDAEAAARRRQLDEEAAARRRQLEEEAAARRRQLEEETAARTREQVSRRMEQQERQAARSPVQRTEAPRTFGNYSVKPNVSGGVHNMRTGPGVGHPIVVSIPAMSSGVSLGRCRAADDGISRNLWCQASWRGNTGWVSRSGISGF